MKKLFLALMMLTATAHSACTVMTTGLGLSIPNYGDRGDVWAGCIRTSLVNLNTGVLNSTMNITGRLGFNVPSPQYKIDMIYPGAFDGLYMLNTGDNGSAGIRLQNNSTLLRMGVGVGVAGSLFGIYDGIAGATRFLINSSGHAGVTDAGGNYKVIITTTGRIGIDNVNPTYRIDMTNAGAYNGIYILNTGDNGAAGIRFQNNATLTDIGVGAGTAGSKFGIKDSLLSQNLLLIDSSNNVLISSYTQLGSNAPKIQMISFSTTTALAQGGSTYVLHGLTGDKIISISAVARLGSNSGIPHSYLLAGYQFDISWDATKIYVDNMASSSGNILNKVVEILVTYKE